MTVKKHLPPLNALKVFDIAADQLNFSRAGEELNMTHSAVSQHIKRLEGYLAKTLFLRKPGNRLALTEEGERYAEHIHKALRIINDATVELTQDQHSTVIHLNLSSSMATYWLIPRLADFQASSPDLELRLATPLRPNSLQFNDIDAAIQYNSQDHQDDYCSDFLLQDRLVPVCSPKLLQDPAPLKASRLIHLYPFINIRHTVRTNDLENWCKHYQCAEPQVEERLTFEHTIQGIQAALNGLGILVTHLPLVANLLKLGHLIIPTQETIPGIHDLYLTYPNNFLTRNKIAPLRQWLLKTTQEFLDEVPASLLENK
ncbi:LysR substrate-binding domain-containing protein [Piscirickettsia litoralis]|uniref:LysR family transcriptional regulator n=1 Tax=Piscirickettsia litoralis TaxID=1891921 RepID=A0ABX3A047_9GAMM|nr:LysR substrate-binding domain-containing protein [Piscirickettsia litoralis]ODN42148.1 LysR family transcriptional regulator [Piscirickettsia litoralis]